MNQKLIIIGAKGHGKVVADIAMKLGKWNTINFLDEEYESGEQVMGLEVLGKSSEIKHYISSADFFVGIGNYLDRKRNLENLEKLNASVVSLVHPSAVIGKEVTIGKGTAVMAGVVINNNTLIGKGCIINTSSSIDHDNNLEDYVHISPGAHLAGTVFVGENSWIGIGAIVSNNLTVCSNCMIGAGGVVIKDVNQPGTYVGVPVKKLYDRRFISK